MKQIKPEDYSHRIFLVSSGLFMSKDTAFSYRVTEYLAKKTKTRYETVDNKRISFDKFMKLDTSFVPTVPSFFTWCENEADIEQAITLIQQKLIESCEKNVAQYELMAKAAREPVGEVMRRHIGF